MEDRIYLKVPMILGLAISNAIKRALVPFSVGLYLGAALDYLASEFREWLKRRRKRERIARKPRKFKGKVLSRKGLHRKVPHHKVLSCKVLSRKY